MFLKLECFQPIRVFKLRGASNKVRTLGETERRRGVVTASSGNHGIAVAYAAWRDGLEATVYVPENANPAKVKAIEQYGARLVRIGAIYDDTFQAAVSAARRRRATFVHAFDDPGVISGQGTIGLEINEQLGDVRCVVVPVGGGGLISGIACALKALRPSIRMVGVQTRGCQTMFRSWGTGTPHSTAHPKTIADGMLTRDPGVLTLALMRQFVDEMVLVADRELLRSMRKMLDEHRLLVEPAGAAAVAALPHLKLDPDDKVVLIISGGNVAPDLLRRLFGVRPR